METLHDNAPTHRSVLVKDFLEKNNMITLQHPPYSSDLIPADFYLFPCLNSAVKWQRFCDAADIIKNATEELKCFQTMASRNFVNIFKVAGRSVQLYKMTILKSM